MDKYEILAVGILGKLVSMIFEHRDIKRNMTDVELKKFGHSMPHTNEEIKEEFKKHLSDFIDAHVFWGGESDK